MSEEKEARQLRVEIVEEIGVLSESGNWRKELNVVQWGENAPKYDIRSWNADHTQTGKGITLSLAEMKELKKLLEGLTL